MERQSALLFIILAAGTGVGATSHSARSIVNSMRRGGSLTELPIEKQFPRGARSEMAGSADMQQRHYFRNGSGEPRLLSDWCKMFQAEGWEGDVEVSDWEPFRELGRDMVDYVADYFQRVETFPVRAQVKPGYLKKRLFEQEFPVEGEKMCDIMADFERHILPGITHWQHPRFFGYFPSNTCPPGVLADMLSSMLNVVSFSWEASPAATELEVIVLDQMASALGLPDVFKSTGDGGGALQSSASETTMVAMLAARTKNLKHLRRQNPWSSDQELFARMTLYTSDQAHSSIQKTANIVGLGANLRLIPTKLEDGYAIDADALAAAMCEDRARGFVPIFVAACVGTTNSCAIDSLHAVGEVCRRCPAKDEPDSLSPWLHVDAAYAGVAAVCPENRWIFDSIDGVDSLGVSLHKALLVNWDCACMWTRRKADIRDALSLTPAYLMSEEYHRGEVMDFRDWQVSLGRRTRSLKLWFVMRTYGLHKVREFVRHHTRLALMFQELVETDDRFEIVAPTRFGLVTFRLRASDEDNEELRARVLASGTAFFSPMKLEGRTCLRLAIGAVTTEERHILQVWDTLQRVADDVLSGTTFGDGDCLEYPAPSWLGRAK